MKMDEGLDKKQIKDKIIEMGKALGFEVLDEVNTGFSKVDVVWFDKRIPFEIFESQKNLPRSFLLPIVGFEIEEKTYVRKMIRGDIESLNSLFPSLGVIVLSRRIATFTRFREELKKYKNQEKAMEVAERRWKTDLETFRRYAEANPFCRIVVLTDKDLIKIYERLKGSNNN